MINLVGITQVDAGARHNLVLNHDGTVWSWGHYGHGRLGTGSGHYYDPPTPERVFNLTDIVEVSAGGAHSLTRRNDGTVWAFGFNSQGQLGDGTSVAKDVAVQTLISNVASISAGEYHSLAVRMDGTVWAWGYGRQGRLGDGTIIDRWTPVQTVGLTDVTAVSGGVAHSLALKGDGTVWVWGWGGRLGDGTTTERHTPVQVLDLTDVVAISAGGYHNLALKTDGTVWGWGSNGYGQVGDGSVSIRLSPVQTQGLSNVVAIAAGELHSLALRSDGSVWAWGHNESGKLGDGTNVNRPLPVRVSDLSKFVGISAGRVHSIAIKQDDQPFQVVLATETVVGGLKSSGTIRFGGTSIEPRLVRMTDDSDAVLMSSFCTVPPNQTAGTFDIWTYGVAVETIATITGRLGNVSRSVQLTITPATLDLLWLVPTAVVGGNPSMGNLRLIGKAPPPSGALVTLSTNDPAAANHATTTVISWGASQKQFPVSTFGVDATRNVTILATYAGVTRTANLSVRPAALSGLSLSSTSVVGGMPVAGTVTMSGKTGPLGRTVWLGSDEPTIMVPGSTYVPPQKFSTNFTV